jgi:hypothetical protein
MVANPFNDGNGNNISNILSSSLPKQSQVLTWNGVSFNTFGRSGTPPSWGLNTTNLPPGIGFFVRNGSVGSGSADVTNTWVGSLAANSGTTVTNVVVTNLNMYRSMIPYAGQLVTLNSNSGDTNINFGAFVGKQSQVQTWNQAGQTYNSVGKAGSPPVWQGTANISVGEGFFVNAKSLTAGPTTNWTQLVP